MIEVEGPDGAIIEFPDDTPHGVMQTALMKHYATAPQNKPLLEMKGTSGALPMTAGERAMDVADSVGGGIIRGAAALPGLPGSLLGLLDRGVDNAVQQTVGRAANRFGPNGTGDWSADSAPKMQVPSDTIAARNLLPTADQTIKGVESIIGKTYQPQTPFGKYAGSIGEFIGGGINPRAAIAPALVSEAAGQMAAGTAAEPWARAAGALIPGAGAAAARNIAPTIPASRQAALDTLRREGVDLTAGQATGSKPLMYAEATLSDMPLAGGMAREIAERQGQQFNRAAAQRMGEALPEGLVTQNVMADASKRIGGQFEDLSARNTLRFDPTFDTKLAEVTQEFSRKLTGERLTRFRNELEDIAKYPGQMPGDLYQIKRSDLSRDARSLRNSDPTMADALRSLRNTLDSAMERSILPADKGAWGEARRQYGNMKVLEKARSGSGAETAQGYISPTALRNAVAGNDRTAFVRGQGDLAELANAGAVAMPTLPNSGTAQRNLMMGILGGGGFVAGGPVGIATGLLGPALAGRTLMSPAVQRFLSSGGGRPPGGPSQQAYRGLLGYVGR